MTWPILTSKCM